MKDIVVACSKCLKQASTNMYVCVFVHSELQLMYVYLRAYLFVFRHKYEDSTLSDSLHLVLTETVECDGRQCSVHCYSSLQ